MGTTCPIREKEQLELFKQYYLKKKKTRNYLLIIIGLNTALRISDILQLQWKDVYDDIHHCFRSHICVIEKKTGKKNQIAINTAVINALKTYYKKQSPETFLFCVSNDESHPISRSQAWRIIKEAAGASGLDEHVSCHSLRKTFGYHAWKQGVPPAMLMSIYNHSSYQITKRYLGIEQDDKDDVFRKINL